MVDWNQYVREHLGALGLSPKQHDFIADELASHLMDEEKRVVCKGSTDEQVLEHIQQKIGSWEDLNRSIQQIGIEEDPMKIHGYTVWLPGVATCLVWFLLYQTVGPLISNVFGLHGQIG